MQCSIAVNSFESVHTIVACDRHVSKVGIDESVNSSISMCVGMHSNFSKLILTNEAWPHPFTTQVSKPSCERLCELAQCSLLHHGHSQPTLEVFLQRLAYPSRGAGVATVGSVLVPRGRQRVL